MFFLSSLISVVTSISITCEFKILSKRQFFGEQYRCLVTEMNFETSCTNIKDVEGKHLPDLTSDDVISFKIDHKTCFYMPRGLDRFFRNIQGIEIIRSKLREVTQSDLKPFADLKIADFRNNKITALEPNLFAFNANLEHIDFSGNQLMFIASGLFELIDDLRSVHLSRNLCISKSAVGAEDIERLKEEIVMKCNSDKKYVTKPRIIELTECQVSKPKPKVIKAFPVSESPAVDINTTEILPESTSEMTSATESNTTENVPSNEIDEKDVVSLDEKSAVIPTEKSLVVSTEKEIVSTSTTTTTTEKPVEITTEKALPSTTEKPSIVPTEAPPIEATEPTPFDQTPTEIFDLKKLVEKLLKGVEVPSIFIQNTTTH